MIIETATIVTIVVIALIVLITLFVGKSKADGSDFKSSLTKIRNLYFAAIMGVICVLLVVTLKGDVLPYVELKSEKPELTVQVVSKVWSWELSQNELPVNRLIEFAVTTQDVNHGFGIYNDAGELLTQVQAMPGYTNRLRYKFTETGVYHILCMEYCGAAHHNMMSEIRVVAAATGGSNE